MSLSFLLSIQDYIWPVAVIPDVGCVGMSHDLPIGLHRYLSFSTDLLLLSM